MIELTISSLILVVVIAVVVAYSHKTILEIITIWRNPTTWISALPREGRVEVIGNASGKQNQTPFKKLPCVFWQLEIYQQKRFANGSYWASMHKDTFKEPFEIDDSTGRIGIQPENVELFVNEESFPGDSDAEIVDRLHSLGIKTKGLLGLFDKKIKIVERYVTSGEEIFITGNLHQSGLDKYVSGGSLTPMIISSQNERETLKVLYIKLLKAMIPIGVVIAVIFLFLVN
jgi:hypothetical protein